MTDLTEFLLARIADDEAVARGVQDEIRDQHSRGVYLPGHGPDPDDTSIEHIDGPMDHPSVVVGPARVLAECEAKRAIVELHQQWEAICATPPAGEADRGVLAELLAVVAFLALPHADHPDYREEWRP